MTPVEEIKSRLDIVEVIRGYIKLEKSGQNWRALCPFHQEKTPSFFVSPSRQSWHCFGSCQTGGDIFSFLMKIENLEFPEALKILAEKAGVTIQKEDPRFRVERNLLTDILERATKFYETNLAATEPPRKYLLQKRGLHEDTVKVFRLGWAKPEWKTLLDHLVAAGFKPQDVERAGLVLRSASGGYFDRFRNRIMFPLFDPMGRVVGFTGRVFEEKQGLAESTETPSKIIQNNTSAHTSRTPNANEPVAVAKYVNTPETSLFSKSKLLYGYHLAKSAIAKEGAALIVEGQMDFLAAWQDGVQNVIAASGTALTEFQLRQLRRICDTLVLAFDMDSAGQMATERGVLLAATNDFTIKIVTLPPVTTNNKDSEPLPIKDVADFALSSPGKLAELVKNSKNLMRYYLDNLKSKFEIESIEGKTRAASYFLTRLKTLASPSEQALWLRELANLTGIREDALAEDLSRTPLLLSENTLSTQKTNESEKNAIVRKSRKEMLAERVLAFTLATKSSLPFSEKYILYFPEKWRVLASQIATGATLNTNDNVIKYLGMLFDYENSLKSDLNPSEELKLSLKELMRIALKEKRVELSEKLVHSERENNEDEKQKISAEISELNQQILNINLTT